jgi:hypothetical protein
MKRIQSMLATAMLGLLLVLSTAIGLSASSAGERTGAFDQSRREGAATQGRVAEAFRRAGVRHALR